MKLALSDLVEILQQLHLWQDRLVLESEDKSKVSLKALDKLLDLTYQMTLGRWISSADHRL